MIDAFHTAKSGVTSYQQSLNIVSNNMANANTTGFKSQRSEFTDLLYQNIRTGDPTIQGGSGTKIITSTKDLSQGTLDETGRLLDFSILGDGFFAVAKRIPPNNTGNGNNPGAGIIIDNPVLADTNTITYTRAGDFAISEVEGKNYLVTKNGEFVLNDKLETIVLEGDLNNIIFSSPIKPEEPVIPPVVTPPTPPDDIKILPKPVSIGIFEFNNPYSLTETGDNKFLNANAGTAAVSYDSILKQQSLERSNIDILTEMQRMITAQRGFQFSSKIIQTADEMEQIANTLSS
ncbi:MAG: protein of unknown function domain protein [Clostridia bacterium]|jgi:flagellar basal-body rod protein FlgG|nr:protein of unknown function domain protein [Clostridia bacterium]